MASKRDANISSYFKPKDSRNAKMKSYEKGIEEARPDTKTEDIPNGKMNADNGAEDAKVDGDTGDTSSGAANAEKDKNDGPADSKSKDALEKTNNKRPSSSDPPTAKRLDTKTTKPSSPPTHYTPKDLPSNWLSSPSTTGQKLSLTSHTGSLFHAATPNTLLIHACNTQGSWGAGIAKAFRQSYPRAYQIYRTYCTVTHNPITNPVPVGTALLIAPVDAGTKHWIGCLFTSAKFGKKKDSKEGIVRNTGPSMEVLLELVRIAGENGESVQKVRMCKINSGLFGVEWERSKEVLEAIEVREGWKGEGQVWEP